MGKSGIKEMRAAPRQILGPLLAVHVATKSLASKGELFAARAVTVLFFPATAELWLCRLSSSAAMLSKKRAAVTRDG
jgi:hypothetical protein